MKANIEAVNINGEKAELIIKEIQGLSEKPKQQVVIDGNIDSVLRFLEKRYIAVANTSGEETDNTVLPLDSHVLICRESKKIALVFNETDAYAIGNVSGKLEIHKDFSKWGINEGTEWSHQKLAEFCKMNRSLFTDPQLAMKLFVELKDVKIKTDKEFEHSNDNRGSERVLVAQKVISSNIPQTFRLKVPIFKGQSKVEFEVELYINPNSFAVTLISPQANDIVQDVLDSIIDDQKKQIQELCPDLVIIEQ